MNKNDKKAVYIQALNNYQCNNPWPCNDPWHSVTQNRLNTYVNGWLKKHSKNKQTILNAGSGNTQYITTSKIVYMDIIEDYIKNFKHYIVGSIDKIPLDDQTIDTIICVGSILNYADAQKSLDEFNRILKSGGTLILEFERSNSAEFLFTKNYAKIIFSKKYFYNNQTHILWLYNEHFISELLNYYDFKIITKHRFHCISSLLYKLGFSEKYSSKFSRLDSIIQLLSYPIAHNVIITAKKFRV